MHYAMDGAPVIASDFSAMRRYCHFQCVASVPLQHPVSYVVWMYWAVLTAAAQGPASPLSSTNPPKRATESQTCHQTPILSFPPISISILHPHPLSPSSSTTTLSASYSSSPIDTSISHPLRPAGRIVLCCIYSVLGNCPKKIARPPNLFSSPAGFYNPHRLPIGLCFVNLGPLTLLLFFLSCFLFSQIFFFFLLVTTSERTAPFNGLSELIDIASVAAHT